MATNQALLSLNAGELTPYLRHRTDFDKHSAGAEVFENFIPLPFGGFRKRPGTVHDASLDAATRLEAFQFNSSTSYILAFTTLGLTVFGADGSPKDTVAFAFGDPFAIQFAHINSLLWIVSPNFHPQLLTRNSDTDWSIASIPWKYPPFLDLNPLGDDFELGLLPDGSTANWITATSYVAGQNVTASTGDDYTCIADHTSSAAGATGDEPGVGDDYPDYWRRRYLPAGETALLSCSPSFPVFDADMVGGYFEILIERDLADYEVELRATSANDGKRSHAIIIQGTWNIITYGNWDGTFFLERSYDGGTTWKDIRSWTSDLTRNVSAEGEESQRCLMRLRYTHEGTPSNKPRAVLSAGEGLLKGIVRIDSFPFNVYSAAVTAITDCDFGTTDFWREGAFSEYRGYPAAISVHERRVWLGGTTRNPVSVWASASDDLLNYTPGGIEDDDAIFVTLASTQQDPIRWMASQRRLILGTSGAEWVFGSEASDDPLTPTNFSAREYTFHGSAPLPALRLNDGVFFVERQRRRLREMAYQLDRESYAAADLTRLAEHITQDSLIQLAWQGNREPALWAVDNGGNLLCFSYIRSEAIASWVRQTTADGLFTSVAVLRNESDDDTVFVVVNRGGTYHLEHFAPGQQATQEAGTLTQCYHVDSGVFNQATDGNLQIDTPAHLDDIELDVMADGYFSRITPSGGKLTLTHAATSVHAGLPITARFIPLPPDIQTESGASHGKVKRSNQLAIALYQSRGGIIYYAGELEGRTIPTIDPDTPLDVPPPLVNSWHRVTLPGGHLKDLQFEIRHATPEPFTVTALALEWALTES